MFRTKAISLDVVLASACLPRLHHAVEIHGEAHWDGGYAANPPLVPLVGASRASDVLLVQLIPTDHAALPVTKSEIDKRLGQITFNSPLQKELEAIGMMKNLLRKEGAARPRAWAARSTACGFTACLRKHYVDGLSQESVLNTDGNFLIDLRDRGRAAADAWLLDEFAPSGRAPFAERHFDSPEVGPSSPRQIALGGHYRSPDQTEISIASRVAMKAAAKTSRVMPPPSVDRPGSLRH